MQKSLYTCIREKSIITIITIIKKNERTFKGYKAK
jgi:hypothetical protein